jgi:hypothetical protein
MAETLRYPYQKIESSDDYLEIGIVKYIAPGISAATNLVQRTSSQSLEKPGSFIYLPIPQNISDSNLVDWGDDSLNGLAAFGVAATADTMQSENVAKGIVDALKSAVGAGIGLLTDGNGQNLLTSKLASEAVKSLGANTTLEGVLSRSGGQVLNPNMELLFKGVKLRSHNFTFDLAPRDEIEASQVKKIIRTFKQEMAARSSSTSGGTGLFISAPSVFKIAYKSGANKHPFLPVFKPCALINMETNYTGSGVYATYNDGTPVHIKLTLSFQELNPVYFEDYNSADGINGVGY